jgi:hypothetical protein
MRITKEILQSRVDYLNKINPDKAYHLYWAYSGVQLARGCGSRNVLQVGFQAKRVTYNLINAYIKGIEDGKCND